MTQEDFQNYAHNGKSGPEFAIVGPLTEEEKEFYAREAKEYNKSFGTSTRSDE
ncbi:hypothetical protein [Streptomyces hebeiensis]